MRFLYKIMIILITGLLCPMLSLSNESSSDSQSQHEDIFRQLFKRRRAEQIEAVKTVKTLQKDKQLKMVMTVTKTIFDVILKSRIVLETSGYAPGLSEFPEKEAVRDALSLILENTALMGDIILRIPDVGLKVLHSTPEWLPLFTWSLTFANQTQLLDNSTAKLFYLVNQELNLTARSPDYINPYRRLNNIEKLPEKEKYQNKKIKKKADLPRGPRLSLPQTGEL